MVDLVIQMENIIILNYLIVMQFPHLQFGMVQPQMLLYQVVSYTVDIVNQVVLHIQMVNLYFDSSSVADGGIAGSPSANISLTLLVYQLQLVIMFKLLVLQQEQTLIIVLSAVNTQNKLVLLKLHLILY